MIAYIAFILMGITLGLMGAGGSILTLPILVYLMGIDIITATSYSLVIVGVTALFGIYRYYRLNALHLPSILWLSPSSIIAVYGVRRYLIPLLPDTFIVYDYQLSQEHLILLIFTILMYLSSYFMIAPPKLKPTAHSPLFLVIDGFIIGAVTGLVGAGGGFMIVPALVLLRKLPMQQALGSSLVIIFLKSMIGFFADQQVNVSLNTNTLSAIIVTAFIGMYLGSQLVTYIPNHTLQKIFGYFTAVLASIILLLEFYPG